MSRWTPEHPVDSELAHELISTQFPEVDLSDLCFLFKQWVTLSFSEETQLVKVYAA